MKPEVVIAIVVLCVFGSLVAYIMLDFIQQVTKLWVEDRKNHRLAVRKAIRTWREWGGEQEIAKNDIFDKGEKS